MDELLTELLVCIAERCDFASLKSLRLVDKTWHGLCNPLVFEHFHMGLFDHCLTKFQALASSGLSKHVKKLTFYCDLLPACGRKYWERELGACVDRNYRHESYLDAAWDAYQSLMQEQQQWQHSEQGKAFQVSFLNLPNLNDVRAIRTVAGDETVNEWPVWKRVTQWCIVGPDQWKKRRGYVRYTFQDTDSRAVLALLEAMGERVSRGLPPVTKAKFQLSCQNFCFTKPLGHDGFGHTVPPSWVNSVKPNIRTAFSALTDLSLYLETGFDWQEFGGVLIDFSHFLSSAKKLRRLTFWFEYYEDFSGDWPDETHLYADQISLFSNDAVVWPEIEHLALKANVPSSKLLNFLKLHSGTLKSLEMRHMFVRDAPLLLENIPKILKLDHVFMQGLWHCGPGMPQEHVDDQLNVCLLGYSTECNRIYESSMKKYLLRETSTMPDLGEDPLVLVRTGYGMNLLDYEPIALERETGLNYSSVASEDDDSDDFGWPE